MRVTTPSPPTPSWFAEFLDALRKEDLAPTTVRGYGHDVLVFLRWFQETNGTEVDLAKLTSIDLMQYRQNLIQVRSQKPATVNRRIEALRRLLRWAAQRGLVLANVAEEVRPVRVVPRRCPLGLGDREVHALLRAAGESKHGLARRNYAIVQLMVQTGLRVGEVAALRVGDVVLRERVGSVRVRQGKGRKEREVPLNASVRRALRLYLDARKSTAAAGPPPAKAAGPLAAEEPLFVSREGPAISVRSLQTVITELASRAKVARLPVSAHTLRHTFALSYLRQNPGNLVDLASLLGHDSLNTTAIYTRPSQEDLAEDLERSGLNVYDG